MRRLTLLLSVLAGLLVAQPAAAQNCVAPPGTAAVEEYCETVPTGTGDRGSGDPGQPAAGAPAKTLARLAKTKQGQALSRALGHDPAKAAKPRQRVKSTSETGSSAPRATGQAPQAPSGNPL